MDVYSEVFLQAIFTKGKSANVCYKSYQRALMRHYKCISNFEDYLLLHSFLTSRKLFQIPKSTNIFFIGSSEPVSDLFIVLFVIAKTLF